MTPRFASLLAATLLLGSFAIAQDAPAPTPAPTQAAAATPDQSAPVASPAPDPAPEGTATVVFYRPKRFVGSALTPSIYVDGEEIARLDNGRYVTFKIKAGKHALKSSMKSHAGIELEFKSGETYYLEVAIQTGNWRGGGRIIPAPAEDATEAMKKLKPLDAQWVYSKAGLAEVSTAPAPAK